MTKEEKKREAGRWKVVEFGYPDEDYYFDCPRCGFSVQFMDGGTPRENEYYFCPRCGKKNMVTPCEG